MTLKPGNTIRKDPDAQLVYEFNWDAWLGDGVQIVDSTFLVSGSGLTKDNESIVSGGRKTRVRLLGGTVNSDYTLTNRIVTNETPAQTEDRSITIAVRER